MSRPKTIIEKLWDSHVVAEPEGAPAFLWIDLHLVHEVTSPQAFAGLRARGLKVRRPDLTLGTCDHSTPTTPRELPIIDPIAAAQVAQFEKNCTDFGIPHFGFKNDKQGIVHVIGPENGATQPGMTVVCGDSHTATHGAFGALAFGIGTSEVEMVLATQCLLQRKSKTFNVKVEGTLRNGVSAKDIILALIARIGVGGGTGCAAIAKVIEGINPQVSLIGVQAERMPSFYQSWQKGEKVIVASADTVADGLAARSVFEVPYAMLRNSIANVVLLSEEELQEGVRLALQYTQNLAEVAGAAALAATFKLRRELAGKKVVVVMTGGNLSLDRLAQILVAA
jgi:3-isopropylmalate/(R)-2-methylmalate dehydratase large subunit